MNDVYWCQQSERDVPVNDGWLSEAEVSQWRNFRFPKRARDWLLGRWTAKLALAHCFEREPTNEVLRRFRVVASVSGAPEAYQDDSLLACSVSISHRSGLALCCASRSLNALGCDIEQIEHRADCFAEDYFTVSEQRLVYSLSGDERKLLVSLFWSAKESVLKVLRTGLRVPLTSIAIDLDSPSLDTIWAMRRRKDKAWLGFHGSDSQDCWFYGLWHADAEFVRTIAAADPIRNIVNCTPAREPVGANPR